MKRVARIARYVGILCLAGMALVIYFYGTTGGGISFAVMFGLLACFCICIPIAVLDTAEIGHGTDRHLRAVRAVFKHVRRDVSG